MKFLDLMEKKFTWKKNNKFCRNSIEAATIQKGKKNEKNSNFLKMHANANEQTDIHI